MGQFWMGALDSSNGFAVQAHPILSAYSLVEAELFLCQIHLLDVEAVRAKDGVHSGRIDGSCRRATV